MDGKVGQLNQTSMPRQAHTRTHIDETMCNEAQDVNTSVRWQTVQVCQRLANVSIKGTLPFYQVTRSVLGQHATTLALCFSRRDT